jgi:hypothetical protein
MYGKLLSQQSHCNSSNLWTFYLQLCHYGGLLDSRTSRQTFFLWHQEADRRHSTEFGMAGKRQWLSSSSINFKSQIREARLNIRMYPLHSGWLHECCWGGRRLRFHEKKVILGVNQDHSTTNSWTTWRWHYVLTL